MRYIILVALLSTLPGSASALSAWACKSWNGGGEIVLDDFSPVIRVAKWRGIYSTYVFLVKDAQTVLAFAFRDGLQRRWSLKNDDEIVLSPDGSKAGYYAFSGAKEGERLPPTYQYSCTSSAPSPPTVKLLQESLVRAGLYAGPVDGIYGQATRTAEAACMRDFLACFTKKLTSDE